VEQQREWVRDFNPFKPLHVSRWPTASGIYEPLMIFNIFKGAYEPWLATGYEWDETDHVVVFQLRKGVQWSDGTPFTARDVVFTFELIREFSELDADHVWSFLRRVEAREGEKVAFVFRHTFVPGLEYLAHLPIVPEHVWKDVADPVSFTNPDPVATGPYTEVLRFEDTVYELGRNPHYWQEGKPAVSVLQMPLFAGNENAVAALVSGTVDWSGNFVPNVKEQFIAADPEHRGSWSPLIGGPVFLYANVTKEPFDQVDVRKALSMAIDRERLSQEAMLGYTRPADATGVGDGQQRFKTGDIDVDAEWIHFDPEHADKLLDEIGYPRGPSCVRRFDDGEPWSFDILVPAGWSDWIVAARIIDKEFSAVGVPVTIQPLPFAEWFERVQKGEFDLSLGYVLESATPYGSYRWLMSTRSLLPVGRSSTTNWHRFGDIGADAFLEAIEMTREEDIQQELFHQLMRQFKELAPAIPLFLGPIWGSYNSQRFVGFPNEENPYAVLSPNSQPSSLIVLTSIRPRK